MKTLRARGRRVVVGRDDPGLTPAAGLVLVAEVDRVLGVAAAIDGEVGSLKVRKRGLSAGELVLAAAESMLAGGDFMVDLDHRRADRAGAALRAVPEPPASTTFIASARRFGDEALAGVEAAMGLLVRRWFAALGEARREALASVRPTIDLDPTDTEVYGKQKEGVGWNYAGQRVGRSHPAVWAEAGVVLAGVLGSGTDDPRPQAPGLIARAVAALPGGWAGPGSEPTRGSCSENVTGNVPERRVVGGVPTGGRPAADQGPTRARPGADQGPTGPRSDPTGPRSGLNTCCCR